MARLAALIIVLSSAVVPATAQSPVIPPPPGYAANPSGPAAGMPGSPVQQQVMQNYRAQLHQAEREMLQQNPSGLSRAQLQISRELNAADPAYNPANPGYVAGAPPDLGVVPSPPFSAAPR